MLHLKIDINQPQDQYYNSPHICLRFKVTPVVPLSNDSWSMSFAKYLELRFYGHQYTRRANAEPCGHSIHKDYHQYFSYNQMVASFRSVSLFLIAPISPCQAKLNLPLRKTMTDTSKLILFSIFAQFGGAITLRATVTRLVSLL